MDVSERNLQPVPSQDDRASSPGTTGLRPEDELWARLIAGSDAPDLPGTWLALQCRFVRNVRAGLLQLGPADKGPFMPAAAWPDAQPSRSLRSIVSEVLAKRSGLTRTAAPDDGGESNGADDTILVAEPIVIDDALHGVVALALSARAPAEVERVRDQLRLGFGWVAAYVQRQLREAEGGSKMRVETVLGLLATALEHDRFQGAATAYATELASELDCDRVSIGFLNHGKLRVRALSHSARFGRRTNLVREIEGAMNEALDEQSTLVYPAPEGALPRALQAHGELSRQFGAQAICTVPLVRSGRACGAVTLERDQPFAGRTLGLVEVASALIAPPLDALRLESRFVLVKLIDSLRETLRDLLGPYHTALKLTATAVVGLLLFLSLASGDFRVTADAVLVPEVRRAAVAPFDGFIAEAPVRAGDPVAQGDLLVSLDDRDLQLELVKWESQYAQSVKQYRQALAERDPSRTEILGAAVEESRAELDRVREQLARADLRAPFDGMVVVGDLSQRLGAPVRVGDLLFEVAPLEAYRAEMKVDETDIGYVLLDQPGTLVLSALPDDRFPFVVSKITPVSAAEEGRNAFLVEGRLAEDVQRLRPGVKGVAKIEIDRRRLIWIWTREAADWLRVKLWKYLP